MEGNSRNCKKTEEKVQYIELVIAMGKDFQKVNNKTNMIAKMLAILLVNFVLNIVTGEKAS